jgi:hypothetical protein
MVRVAMLRGVLTAPVLALVAAGAALGAQPVQKFHDHFTDSFPADVCGIAVDVNETLNNNFFLYADGSSTVAGNDLATLTNPLNGKAVIQSAAGQNFQTASVVDESANTITFDLTYKGLPEKIQTSHGPVLTRDAGLITFRDTFDLTTGDFISEQTIVSKGPHPDADSDFTLYCQVITGALS